MDRFGIHYGRPTSSLNQGYLGVQMIRNHFSDVNYISRDVLTYLNNIPPDIKTGTTRYIRKLSSMLQNVQYGKVTKDNCINWDKETQKHKEIEWSKDQSLVKVLF